MEGSIISHIESFHIDFAKMKNVETDGRHNVHFYQDIFKKVVDDIDDRLIIKGLRISVESSGILRHYFVGMEMSNHCCEDFDVMYGIDGKKCESKDVHQFVNSKIINVKFTNNVCIECPKVGGDRHASYDGDDMHYDREECTICVECDTLEKYTISVVMWVNHNEFYPHTCYTNIYTYPKIDSFKVGSRF